MDSEYSGSTVATMVRAVVFPHFSGRCLPNLALTSTNPSPLFEILLSWRVMIFIVSLQALASYIRPTKSVLIHFHSVSFAGTVACSFIPKHTLSPFQIVVIVCETDCSPLFACYVSRVRGRTFWLLRVSGLGKATDACYFQKPFLLPKLRHCFLRCVASGERHVCLLFRVRAAMLYRYPTLSSLLLFELGDEDCERANAIF
jgi:hypothetical protein